MKRYNELDSLRGLAALVVLIGHFMIAFPLFYEALYEIRSPNGSPWWVAALNYSPLHIFWAGRESVLFFFVLSGFVLALPYFDSKRQPSYGPYMVKRVLRLYPPYILAILCAVALRKWAYHGDVPGLSDWFNQIWRKDVTSRVVFDHAGMIGVFDNSALDPVIWSLVHEMRISLIFPIIALLVSRQEKLAIALACIFFPVEWMALHLRFVGVIHNESDLPQTVTYIAIFFLGAMLAKRHEMICERWTGLTRTTKVALMLAAIVAYTNSYWQAPLPWGHSAFFANVIEMAITVAGVVVFIVASLASGRLSPLLRMGPVHFLGKISYSLYLYHFLCLKAGLGLLLPQFPIWLALTICFAASIVVAVIGYYGVEVPGIYLGREIARRWPTLRKPAVTVRQ